MYEKIKKFKRTSYIYVYTYNKFIIDVLDNWVGINCHWWNNSRTLQPILRLPGWPILEHTRPACCGRFKSFTLNIPSIKHLIGKWHLINVLMNFSSTLGGMFDIHYNILWLLRCYQGTLLHDDDILSFISAHFLVGVRSRYFCLHA